MSNSEQMARVDMTWLRMERPANLMVIVGVLVLAGPVDVRRLEETLAARMLAIPRFRQRTEERPTGIWWIDDAHFDIARHIKRIRLPGSGDKAELQRFVADLASTPLDTEHPLWQFHIVEDYEGGAALVARIHHAMGDGIAMIGVLLSLTDGNASPARQTTQPVSPEAGHDFWSGFVERFSGAMTGGLRFSIEALRRSLDAVASPSQLLRDGTGIAAELAYLLLMPGDSPTRFKGVPSGNKRIAWSEPIVLPEVKAVSDMLGCSINDMLLTAVAGALRGYLAEKGDQTSGVEVRALVPVNLRPVGGEPTLGNRFGIVGVELPLGLENSLTRLGEIHRRMEALKRSYEPLVTLGLLEALGYAPQAVQDRLFDLLLSRASAVMTNLPGPQQPLYLAGSEIEQMMFWVPQAGNIGMGVSILSFNGQVQFGLITDAAIVPDPETIIARFRPEFEQLLYFVLLGGNARPDGTSDRQSRARKPRRRVSARRTRKPTVT